MRAAFLSSGNAGLLDDQKDTEGSNSAKDNTMSVDFGEKLNTIEATTPSMDAAGARSAT